MFRASLCPSSGEQDYKTACGVCLVVLAVVLWSWDVSCADCVKVVIGCVGCVRMELGCEQWALCEISYWLCWLWSCGAGMRAVGTV